MSPDPNKPRGREQVREALLETATRLFSAQGPRRVSIREVAAAAGVNHGLVHRHFGSKAQLQTAVLDRLVENVGASMQTAEDAPLDRLVQEAFERTQEHDAYFRILAWTLLEGEAPSMQSRFPVVERLLGVAGNEDDRRHAARRVARLLAMGLG